MIFFFSIPFFVYSFVLCRKKSVAFYLSLFIGLNLAATVFSPLVQGVDNLADFLNMGFTILVLLIIVHSFRFYCLDFLDFSNEDLPFFWVVVVFLVVVLSVSFFINLYVVYKSSSYVFSNSVNITDFKNDGLAHEMIRQWVNSYFVSFANIFSSFGYLALSLHFFFMVRGRFVLSFIFLVLSLNLPLNSLHGLSRSGILHFFIVYVFFFLYVYPALNARIRSVFKKISILFFGFFLLVFIMITQARFGNDNYHSRYEGLSGYWSHNQELLSVIDYATQWSDNGLKVLDVYSVDQTWYGKSSFKFFELASGVLGVDYDSYSQVRKQTLGSYSSKFLGLVAVLVYDFGYVLSLLVVLVFFFFVRQCSPVNYMSNCSRIIYFPILIAVPVMFFTNNYLSNTLFSVGMVFSVLCGFFIRFSFRYRS